MKDLQILPPPKSIEMGEGEFSINDACNILLDAGTTIQDLLIAERLKAGILEHIGFELSISRCNNVQTQGNFVLRINEDLDSPELYCISIGKEDIVVSGASHAGLRYGVETLLQVVSQSGIDIPSLEIRDCPDYAVRGFYHDVTRGQVPNLDTLKQIADLCVNYKINHLELYVEHCFRFMSLSEIGAGIDSLTSEDILELDRYCQERYIDLVPSISTFGHMYEVLRTKSFAHLNELDIDAGSLPFSWLDRMGHYTLDADNPKSIELVSRMLDDFIPLFSSKYVNICCDETWDLCKGKNLGKSRSELYIKHLLAVIDIAKRHGKRALFWGDIVFKHEDLLNQLPVDAIILNWNYGPDPDESCIARSSELGLTQYVCPGINAWSSFAARINEAESNIRKTAEYGKKHGAGGLLNTNWGDHGHLNLLSASIHGIVMGASYAWNVDGTPGGEDYDIAFSHVIYGDDSERLGCLLRELGDIDPGRSWLLDDKTYADLKHNALEQFNVEVVKSNRDRAGLILRELESLRAAASKNIRRDYDEFVWTARAIVATLDYLLLMICGSDIDIEALASPFERLFMDYANLWRRRNKESELFRIREAFVRTAARIRESKRPV